MTEGTQLRGPRIQVADAVKTIDGIPVLDRVAVTADAGRVTALLGPNGAGKSTLLRAVAGLVPLDAGTATVGGRPLADHAVPATVVGALITVDGLHPGRTASGHLRVAAAACGRGRERVEEVLTVVGLAPLTDVRVGEMSLGMKQRLALATALIGDPGALILDEPHNGLDAEAIRWLRTLLRRFVDAGRTVLVSSHLLDEVQSIADDVVVMHRGGVVAAGAVDRILLDRTQAGALEEWYFRQLGVSA